MKICFWGSIYSSLNGKPVGGGELQLSLIIKHLNQLGEKIYVIDSEIPEDTELDGIIIYSLKKRINKRILSKYFSFYKLLKKVNADVYYARIRSSLHLIGLLAAQKNNSIFVYHVASDLDTLGLKERWNGYYIKASSFTRFLSHFVHSELLFPFVLRNADLIITQHLEQTKNLHKKGIKNIAKFPNLFDFSKSSISNQILNNSINFNEYYISIGSLDRRKGIESLELMITKLTNINFIIIGKARDKYGRKFVARINKFSNVKYFSELKHSIVLEYIKNAKALISTSVKEGFSNVFLEAWGLGIPVLSLNVNPSCIISNQNLGKHYSCDLLTLLSDIEEGSFNFNKNELIKYVKNYHDPIKICNGINNKLNSLKRIN